MTKVGAVITAWLALCGFAAHADEFWHGKTIRLIVGSAAGGSYDSYARVDSRYFAKYLPGNPTIIVQNMPGAGGLTATNYVFNVAPRDGTAFGILNRNTIAQPIIGNDRARFRPEQFQWIGTPASFKEDPYLFLIRGSLPYRSAEELRTVDPPATVSNSGDALLNALKETLALNVKVIRGYDKAGANLAFERGEVDAIGYGYSYLQQVFPDWIRTGFVRPLVQFGSAERSHAFPEIPTAQELAQSPDDRLLIKFMELPLSVAFPYAMPPGVPDELVKAMRAAFSKTMQDADYLAELQKQHLAHSPEDGQAIQAAIANLSRAPQEVISRFTQLVGNE